MMPQNTKMYAILEINDTTKYATPEIMITESWSLQQEEGL
jgi:hypothetical protein